MRSLELEHLLCTCWWFTSHSAALQKILPVHKCPSASLYHSLAFIVPLVLFLCHSSSYFHHAFQIICLLSFSLSVFNAAHKYMQCQGEGVKHFCASLEQLQQHAHKEIDCWLVWKWLLKQNSYVEIIHMHKQAIHFEMMRNSIYVSGGVCLVMCKKLNMSFN